MARGRGNMKIFRKMGHFSKILIVWGVRVGVLVACGASCKTDGNLRAKM
jgi:hypothetical protein